MTSFPACAVLAACPAARSRERPWPSAAASSRRRPRQCVTGKGDISFAMLLAEMRDEDWKEANQELLTAVFEELKDNTSFLVFNCSEKTIGVEACTALAKAIECNKTLKELDLAGTINVEAGCKLVLKALQKNATLTKIDLSCCALGAHDGKLLAALLTTNSTLKTLRLEKPAFDVEALQALTEALQHNTTLTDLKLDWWNSNGEFEDDHDFGSGEVGEIMAKMLEGNTGLTRFSFNCNMLFCEGVVLLLRALKKNKTLTELSLCEGFFDFECCKAFAEMLQSNSTLSKLLLYDNFDVTPGGVGAFAKALPDNTSLTYLNFAGSDLGDEGCCALAEALKRNVGLTELDLCDCDFGDKGVKMLAEGLKSNKTITSMDITSKIKEKELAALVDMLESNNTLCTLTTDYSKKDCRAATTRRFKQKLRENRALRHETIPMMLASPCFLAGEEIALDLKEMVVAFL